MFFARLNNPLPLVSNAETPRCQLAEATYKILGKLGRGRASGGRLGRGILAGRTGRWVGRGSALEQLRRTVIFVLRERLFDLVGQLSNEQLPLVIVLGSAAVVYSELRKVVKGPLELQFRHQIDPAPRCINSHILLREGRWGVRRVCAVSL